MFTEVEVTKFLLGILVFLCSLPAYAGCTFQWHTYGDNQIRDIVSQRIGSYVPDEYCKKFNKSHEIVIIFDAFTLRDMCVGYATVSLRKRGSETQQKSRNSAVTTNTNCRSMDGAYELAAQSSLDALKSLMANLSSIKVTN